jgi:hypothetical protein
VNKETYEGEAEEACWEYFKDVQKRYALMVSDRLKESMVTTSGFTVPMGTMFSG